MGSIQNVIDYCCVAKGYKVLYAYGGGGQEIDDLARLCLERAPSFHYWYSETFRHRTFGFLMEDGYVYFAIMDESLGNSRGLRFLERVKDGFKKIMKNGSKSGLGSLNPICVEEQLVPVIQHLISSLENVSRSEPADWVAERPTRHISPSQFNGGRSSSDATVCKAPLLGKPSKHEKKKMKGRLVETRDIISEDHRKSTDRGIMSEDHRKSMDRGIKIDVVPESNQGSMSSISLQKSSSSTRIRGQQQARKIWWRHVRLVLAIDAAVCLILFGIWLAICRGFQCMH
ncbi:hypothetical protein ACLOJK_016906 [Asimina triloba]